MTNQRSSKLEFFSLLRPGWDETYYLFIIWYSNRDKRKIEYISIYY